MFFFFFFGESKEDLVVINCMSFSHQPFTFIPPITISLVKIKVKLVVVVITTKKSSIATFLKRGYS